MIELLSFSKSYHEGQAAVEGVTFTCEEGMITGLLGENGAGKTTVLKAVAARHFASSGSVRVHGIDAEENPSAVRTLVGFVPEVVNFSPEYTVKEELTMTAQLHGVQHVREAVLQVVNLCSLSEVYTQKIATLSKGYRERLAFADALIFNPPVLVLDEPASGLDPAQIVRMRNLIRTLAKGRTILLSTHLMQEVDALCDRICILHKGKTVAYGRAEEIARQNDAASLEEAFFRLTQGENAV